ncbi:hypothetical protein Agub_g8056, partial [Astrephomene gubernaculifera]
MSAPGAHGADGRGPGLDILDEVAAAQQYVLDLQVLFYSLKTVAANSRKDAALAGAEAGTNASAVGDSSGKDARRRSIGTSTPPESNSADATAVLQQQIDTLIRQLEVERVERARVQEQYDQAAAMLRKSYGQIVDDYLFATAQLHARTKQLEALIAATAPAAAAAAAPEDDEDVAPEAAAAAPPGEPLGSRVPKPAHAYQAAAGEQPWMRGATASGRAGTEAAAAPQQQHVERRHVEDA